MKLSAFLQEYEELKAELEQTKAQLQRFLS